MKNLYLTLILVALFSMSSAQDGIGIGTTDVDESAVLHIESSSKGVLLPRIEDPEDDVSTPTKGLVAFNTSDSSLYVYNGSWQPIYPIPKGGIIMWSGSEAPEGWAICDGNDGTPDLSGRFIVGYDPTEDDYDNPGDLSIGGAAQGDTGGQDSVKLDETEMPSHIHDIYNDSHSHTGTADYGGGHSHPITWSDGLPLKENGNNEPDRSKGGNAAKKGPTTSASIAAGTGKHSHSLTIPSDSHDHNMASTGGDKKHENRPPYYVLAFIMKL